ncbi:NB-ARC domain disease resistance protein [Medicago truncatula]|uniref:NB-ARC domain disease resistance protein n=1 Tax=Medicago truncatula TaxID=3880 RepID=G7JK88_MEDTR|nr:NB-ARC domain disease resistance protein [Medicago truncatula]
MAESLLFGVAESFISKLASVAVNEASLALAVLLDAEQKQWQNNELREWLKQINRVFYDAEDVIDDFECEALRKHVINTSGSIRRKVKCFFSNSNPLVYRFQMAHQIKHIKERFDKFAADRLKFGLQINDSDNRVVKRRELTHSYVIDSDVIGRKHDKQKIINLLLQDSGDSNSLSVIPIVGIGGLGKTTLAKVVFNDKSLDETFPLKMWVCVSDDFELENLLVKILNSASVSGSALGPNPIHQENYTNLDLNQLQNHLRNVIPGKKFLLVLDDVWNEDRVKWVELKNLIQVGAEGSKLHSIAKMMGINTSYILELEGLFREDSLSVFVKWAFEEGEEKNYPKLMEIGKEIVQKCGGLPLALRTLGSSLFLKDDIEEWKFNRDSEIWDLPQKDDDILSAIKNVLWVAFGFLPPPNMGKTLEDISIQFLYDLQSRSFIQDFVDFGGGFCGFKLHDLVHDLSLYVARDEFQLLKFHDENIFENVLHLSFIKNDLLGLTRVPTGLRTMLFPKGANNEAFLKTLASRFKFLRVLRLAHSKYESFPQSAYFDLDGCIKLQTLPNGIGNLISLRQLYITTHQSTFPDKEIEYIQLSNLKLLEIGSCGSLKSMPPIHVFPNLEALGIDNCLKLPLNTLQTLVIDGCENLEELPQWFSTLICLKILRIRNCPKLFSLPEDLHCLPNLESLKIEDCPELGRRYRPGVGRDWHKISHIKEVIVESTEFEN